MAVTAPSFRVLIMFGEFAYERGVFAHRFDIRAVSLGSVEPRALADVTREHRGFSIDDGRNIDVAFGAHDFAENIATSVRRGVIDRDVFEGRWGRRIDRRVGHALAERGGIDETHRVLVVFHVVGRGLA